MIPGEYYFMRTSDIATNVVPATRRPSQNKHCSRSEAIFRFALLKIMLVTTLMILVYAGPALAQHIKAIQSGAVLNPIDWDGLYDPGMVVSKAIAQRGMTSPNVLWMKTDPPKKENINEEVDPLADLGMNSASKPKAKKELPVQFILESELQVFNPHVDVPVTMAGFDLEEDQFAEVQIHIKLIDNFTKRIVSERYIWAVGGGGTDPFPNTPESLIPGHPDFQKTSMGRAIESLTEKLFDSLSGVLNEISLDAQILFVDEAQDMVTLNVGRRHGVKVGDDFTIYKLTRSLEDPITGADLGDHFKRLGAVRVAKTGDGFSEAVLLLGVNFKRGLLARGEKQPLNILEVSGKGGSGKVTAIESRRPFEDFIRARETPRDTITRFDFFSIMGFELDF